MALPFLEGAAVAAGFLSLAVDTIFARRKLPSQGGVARPKPPSARNLPLKLTSRKKSSEAKVASLSNFGSLVNFDKQKMQGSAEAAVGQEAPGAATQAQLPAAGVAEAGVAAASTGTGEGSERPPAEAGAPEVAVASAPPKATKKTPVNTRRGWGLGKPSWAMGGPGRGGKGGCPCCAGPTHEETWRDEMGAMANLKQ